MMAKSGVAVVTGVRVMVGVALGVEAVGLARMATAGDGLA
jgi:hypothetical protein